MIAQGEAQPDTISSAETRQPEVQESKTQDGRRGTKKTQVQRQQCPCDKIGNRGVTQESGGLKENATKESLAPRLTCDM